MDERYEANRLIAFYTQQRGDLWIGIDDNLRIIAIELGVDFPEGKRRSKVAIACASILRSKGVVVPSEYITPWGKPRGDKCATAGLAGQGGGIGTAG